MTVGYLKDYHKEDVNLVGGKGANLGELINNGFPIPPGFVICADEYGSVISDLEAGAEHVDYRSAIRDWILPASLGHQIKTCHDTLQADRSADLVYAVRSSATAEDLGDASFAGQHETFYYVTYDDLIPMIKACWISLWSDEAIAYRETQGIEHHGVLMAVVVQEMIPSDISGITFTANPLTGTTEEIVTDASWGMGAAIVDGRVTPDHYVMLREHETITSHKISNKTRMVSTTKMGDGNRLIDVPYHQQHVSCLSDEQIVDVARWALKAEAHFGKPQDLEWAMHDNVYYMLQSRPITTLEASDDDEKPVTRKLVLFKAFAENFTEPLLPLTVDILNTATPTEFYKGRMYQDILPARVLLPIKMTDEQAAELMYWEIPENFKIRINWLMLVPSLLFWLVFYLMFGISQARSRRMPDDFMDKFRARVKTVDDDKTLTPGLAMVDLFFNSGAGSPIGNHVMQINTTSVLRYFGLMGILNKLLSWWIPDIQRDAGSLLCSGSYGVKSTEMGRNIFKLSLEAKKSVAVIEVFQGYKPDEIFEVLANTPEAKEFLSALDEFLSEHGHRALKEFELASPRFEENPAPVLAMIKNYMGSDSNPDEMEQHTTDARVELADLVQERLKDKWLEDLTSWRWRLVSYMSNRARHFIKLRENSRFFHIMAWASARKKIVAAEEVLRTRGQLKVKNDIFYLKWVEVEAMLAQKLGWSDVEELIRTRRMQHLRWTNQGAPKLINIESTVKSRVLAKGQLGGQGASPGQYEGIARVIMDPSVDAEIHPGEILVAPYTDPAWTPLFLIARGAVVGVGSYLSHAGTIAREYGMPCVVDVDNCTSLIRTGDRILVDGTEGVVHLIDDDVKDQEAA